jgi:type III secretion system chaperone SycN
MSWVDQTIAAFGQTIGIPGLSLGPHKMLELKMEHGGALGFLQLDEENASEVLVHRSRPLGFDAARRIRRALRLTDFRHPSSWPTQVGVRDEELILAMRIPERAFTPDVVEQALSELTRMHAQVDEGR